MPWVIIIIIKKKQSVFCKAPLRQNRDKKPKPKSNLTTHLLSRTLIKMQQINKVPKQVMCLVAYVRPRDNYISLSPPQLCFMLDEFIKILPGKSATIS